MPDLKSRYPQQYLLKNLSVYVGVAGYVAMLITGDVVVGAWSKLLAESLRYPYYKVTQANDMAGLSIFFILASLVLIIPRFFLWLS
jgi:hypothetical protein